MSLELIIRSILLGVGLAMDAFSVSIADGLSEQNMRKRRMLLIAGTFAVFQFLMPLTGWWLVTTAVDKFRALEKYIPWIALLLLLYIGGGMLKDGIKELKAERSEAAPADESCTAASAGGAPAAGTASAASGNAVAGSALTLGALLLQGIATSIDALSVGFTIEGYGLGEAFGSSLIIGIVTLFICLAGLILGKTIGTRLNSKAGILGGVILIAIGLEIWITGVFF